MQKCFLAFHRARLQARVCSFFTQMTFTNHCLLQNARQFADDTIAYLTIYSELDSGILQNDLEKLKLNGSKCGINARSSEVARNVSLSCMSAPFMVKPYSNQSTLQTIQALLFDQTSVGTVLVVCLSCKQYSCFPQTKSTGEFAKDQDLRFLWLVRPLVKYAATVWDPHTAPHTDINIRKIEMVQRLASCFLVSNYDRTASVGAILDELGWKSLAIFCFRILENA